MNATPRLLVIIGAFLFMPTTGITEPSETTDINTSLASPVKGKHAIAMHGLPRYPKGFSHFDYVNPKAPKGGKVVRSEFGSYDSFNPFIIKGSAVTGIGYIYDTLTVGSHDEAFTQYGLIAKSVEIPEDRTSVTFHINPDARFNDGHPITAEDVEFTFNKLITEGSPFYGAYYGDVTNLEILNTLTIKFNFKNGQNRELPLILGQINVLPAHYWKDKDFTKMSLTPPLGSGPYKIKTFKTGHSVTYERVENYWAKNHPARKGQYNIDEIRFDYYRDPNVALEAFKSLNFDYVEETSAKRWATQYAGNAFDANKLIKTTIPHQNTAGMQGFAFNIRKPAFKDVRVRQALNLAFDFEWINKNLFYNAYTRTDSYFDNSELASSGLPAGKELAILKKFEQQLPPTLFTEEVYTPTSKGNGSNRQNLRKAIRLLKEAGWQVKNKQLVNAKGEQFAFEFLIYLKDFERVILPYVKSLQKLGIKTDIRLVDRAQYIERIRAFDFDMVIQTFGQSSSPGNEQREFWGSAYAESRGSRNIVGISSPVIDDIIEILIAANTRDDLIASSRALDRMLLWGSYVVPQWHITTFRVAYRDFFGRPTIAPTHSIGFDSWWVKPTTDVTGELAQ